MSAKQIVQDLPQYLCHVAKVTLLLVFLIAVAARGDDLVMVNGKRYEKVHITEITPAAVAFTHACGAASVPLSEFTPDVQKRFGYDPAKASAWMAEQAKAEQARQKREADAAAAEEKQRQIAAREATRQINAITDYLDSGGKLEYDPVTKQLYDPDVRARQRAALFEWWRKNAPARTSTSPHPSVQSSPH